MLVIAGIKQLLVDQWTCKAGSSSPSSTHSFWMIDFISNFFITVKCTKNKLSKIMLLEIVWNRKNKLLRLCFGKFIVFKNDSLKIFPNLKKNIADENET